MGIDIHMWIEGKEVEGDWLVANPRYVDLDTLITKILKK